MVIVLHQPLVRYDLDVSIAVGTILKTIDAVPKLPCGKTEKRKFASWEKNVGPIEISAPTTFYEASRLSWSQTSFSNIL